MKARNFRSKSAYRRWLAFGHIHHVFKGRERIKIRGRLHKVIHSN